MTNTLPLWSSHHNTNARARNRAPEEIECTREETDDENVRGGGSSSTTTTSSFETEFFKTFGAEMGSGGMMPPLPFPFGAILGGAHNFPFGGDGGAIKGGGDYTASGGGGGGGGGGGSVFGPMAAMAGIFKAFYDFAQEMERMELEEERRMVERSRQADRPSTESAAGGGVLDSFFRRGRGGGGGGGGGSVDGNEKPSRDGER